MKQTTHHCTHHQDSGYVQAGYAHLPCKHCNGGFVYGNVVVFRPERPTVQGIEVAEMAIIEEIVLEGEKSWHGDRLITVC